MKHEVIATRKYNKEVYNFVLNKPDFEGEKGICGIEIKPYITVEAPENCLGYIEGGFEDTYNAHDFYMECMGYNSIFYGIADGITRAMDGGTEEEVKAELCGYILQNGYNPEICEFINGIEWLKNADEKRSGFINCYKEIEGAILKNPIIYQAFTVYFDGKKLDDIRDKYGADLFKECYSEVKKNYNFE